MDGRRGVYRARAEEPCKRAESASVARFLAPLRIVARRAARRRCWR
jgi:hypothetical protein